MPTVGFDVHLTAAAPGPNLQRSDPSFLGSVHLFVHAHHGDEVTQDFSIANAATIFDASSPTITFVPVALTRAISSGKPNLQGNPLRIRRIEIVVQDK
jgi:hypothetical protein